MKLWKICSEDFTAGRIEFNLTANLWCVDIDGLQDQEASNVREELQEKRGKCSNS